MVVIPEERMLLRAQKKLYYRSLTIWASEASEASGRHLSLTDVMPITLLVKYRQSELYIQLHCWLVWTWGRSHRSRVLLTVELGLIRPIIPNWRITCLYAILTFLLRPTVILLLIASPLPELSTLKYASTCPFMTVFISNLILNSLSHISHFTVLFEVVDFVGSILAFFSG